MELREAKQILNENGYVLEEGKLGRALTAGALALGLAAGNSNAINQDDIDRFEKQTELQSKSDVRYFYGAKVNSYIKNGNYYFAIKSSKYEYEGLVCLYTDGTYKIKISDNLGYEITEGTYKNYSNYDLEEIVGNLNLLDETNNFQHLSEIKLKNDKKIGLYFTKVNLYDLNKNKLLTSEVIKNGTKHTSFDKNGNIKNVTITKNGITKTLCTDGSIVDGDSIECKIK